ncbi:MAG: MlaD family protein [Pseudomonadota bacterium]
MKKETNKTLIGAFIVGAIALVVIGILAFGGAGLFQASNRYVMYFTGSVKGLSVGAPVQVKGVPVGKVTQINLVYSEKDKSFFTQVMIDVPEGSLKISGHTGARKKELSTDDAVDGMIAKGLRAKLELQSFVTGQLLVAFDFYPDTPVKLMALEDDIEEVPTLPSDMDALAKTLDGIDFQSIIDSIKNAANGIDKLANDPGLHAAVATVNDTLKDYRKLAVNLDQHVARLSGELEAALADVRHLVKTTDGQIPPMAAGINDTAAEIRKTVASLDSRLTPVLANIGETAAAARSAIQQAESMLTNLSYLSDEDSALVYQIDETLAEVKKAAGAMAVLTDYLGRHPEALLKGKGDAPERKGNQ